MLSFLTATPLHWRPLGGWGIFNLSFKKKNLKKEHFFVEYFFSGGSERVMVQSSKICIYFSWPYEKPHFLKEIHISSVYSKILRCTQIVRYTSCYLFCFISEMNLLAVAQLFCFTVDGYVETNIGGICKFFFYSRDLKR